MDTGNLEQKMAFNLRRWQRVEEASITAARAARETTSNPVLLLLLEVLERDSQMHFRVEEAIANSLDQGTPLATRAEVDRFLALIGRHDDLERRAIDSARESLDAMRDHPHPVAQYLLQYLLADEQKHHDLLTRLAALRDQLPE